LTNPHLLAAPSQLADRLLVRFGIPAVGNVAALHALLAGKSQPH
jgi:Asp/Glu/hydantoin racemase